MKVTHFRQLSLALPSNANMIVEFEISRPISVILVLALAPSHYSVILTALISCTHLIQRKSLFCMTRHCSCGRDICAQSSSAKRGLNLLGKLLLYTAHFRFFFTTISHKTQSTLIFILKWIHTCHKSWRHTMRSASNHETSRRCMCTFEHISTWTHHRTVSNTQDPLMHKLTAFPGTAAEAHQAAPPPPHMAGGPRQNWSQTPSF